MSNIKQAALTIIGAVIGGITGGPVGAIKGAYWGLTIGSLAFPAALPTQRGPRFEDLKAQTSEVGAPIQLIYGTMGISGNVFWSTDLHETKHKDHVGGGFLSPSQKIVSYTYSQSFAVGLSYSIPGEATEIQGIRRIWANGKLIYDRTPQRDDEELRAFQLRLTAADQLDSIMTVYTGGQTTADPTIELYEGVGNVPAFMDLAFVVFNEMEMADYGNRAPQLQFEVYTDGQFASTDGVYSNSVLYPWRDGSLYFDSRDSRNLHKYTIEGQPYIQDFSAAATAYCGLRTEIYAFSSDNVEGCTVFSGSPNLPDYSSDPVIAYVFTNLPGIPAGERYYTTPAIGDNNNVPYWSSQVDSDGGHVSPFFSSIFQVYGNLGSTIWTPVPRNGGGLAIPPNSDYAYWTDQELWIKRFPTSPPNSADLDGAISIPGIPGAVIIGDIVFPATDWVYDDTHTYKVLAPYVQSDSNDQNAFVTQYPLNPCLRSDDDHYSDAAYWTAAYDDAVIAGTMPAGRTYGVHYPTVQAWAYVNVSGSGVIDVSPVSVADIVDDLCERCDITTTHRDTSDVDSYVDGYAIGAVMSARNAITPLATYGLFSAVETSTKLRFVERGASVARTLVEDDLCAHEPDEENKRPPIVTVTRQQEVDLPQVVRVNYISAEREYQQASEPASRKVVSSDNSVDLAVPVNMSATKAAQLAEIHLYDAWMARNSYEFVTSHAELDLEPTDCIIIPNGEGDTTERVRILESSSAIPGTIEFRGVRDDPEVLISYATRGDAQIPADLQNPGTALPGPTELILLDIPGLTSDIVDAGYYAAGRGYLPLWSGYEITRSFNGGTEYTNVAATTDEATIGTLVAVLGITDDEITLTADSGTFSSATQAELDSGANVLAVGSEADGWELMQFEVAVLDSSVWILSSLRRQILGTDITTHAVGERVVLMTGGGVLRIPLPASQVNVLHLIKPVSIGNTVAETTAVEFTSTGQSLRSTTSTSNTTLTVVSATTTAPPDTDNPFTDATFFGHWWQTQLLDDDTVDVAAVFTAAPHAKAYMQRVYWKEVEPTFHAFDFTVQLARLAQCAALSKFYLPMFLDRSYNADYSTGDPMLPADIVADTSLWGATSDGSGTYRWKTAIKERLKDLHDAWFSAVNSSGNAAWCIGVATQETAHGFVSTTGTGYSAQSYASMYVEVAQNIVSQGFWHVWFANHFTGGREWISTIMETCAPLGKFMAGGPDDWWINGGILKTDLYPKFLAHKDTLPIFIGMSQPSYNSQSGSPMLTGAKFARDSIGARVIIWMKYDGGTVGHDTDAAADVIENTMPTFNGSTTTATWDGPPGTYLLPLTGTLTGAWAPDADGNTHNGELATWDPILGQWIFTAVSPGTTIYVQDTGTVNYTSDGTTIEQPPWDTVFDHDIFMSGIDSPAVFSANQDDYAFADDITSLRLSASGASRNLSGLVAPTGAQLLMIHNVGTTYSIILKDESASSTAINRFALAGDVTLAPDQSVMIWYDTVSTRWRVLDANGSSSANGNNPVFILEEHYGDDAMMIPGPIGATGATGATGASGSGSGSGGGGMMVSDDSEEQFMFPPMIPHTHVTDQITDYNDNPFSQPNGSTNYYIAVTAETSVVAFWPGNETSGPILDVVRAGSGGSSSTPTYGNTVAVGLGAKAVGFDSSGDLVSGLVYSPMNDFSIEMWFSTTATLSAGAQFYSQAALMLADTAGAANDWGLGIQGAGKPIFGVGNSDTSITPLSGTWNDGVMHHVCCTRNGTTGAMIMYIDGTSVATGTGPTGVRNGQPASWWCGPNVSQFIGLANGWAIHNSILTPTQVAAHYASGSGGYLGATGDLIYRNSGGGVSFIPVGTGTQVLGVVAGLPAYVAGGSGGQTIIIREESDDGGGSSMVIPGPPGATGSSMVSGVFSGASVKFSSNTAVTAGVKYPWSSAEWDTDNYWSAGTPSKFTIPAGGAGKYLVNFSGGASASSNWDYRLWVNGVQVRGQYGDGGFLQYAGDAILDLAVGDYIEVDSGTNHTEIASLARLQITRLFTGSSYNPAMTAPLAADFTWVNQGSSTSADKTGRMLLTVPRSAGLNMRGVVKSLPATPYTVTAALGAGLVGNSSESHLIALSLRDSGSGKIITWCLTADSANEYMRVLRFTNETSLSASPYVTNCSIVGGLVWLRITDDGTDRRYWISGTGKDWSEIFTDTHTTFMTADQVGIFILNNLTGTTLKTPVPHFVVSGSVLGDDA